MIRPDFDRTVAPTGYAWWYLDALSDDGQRGLTLIAFVGSVFSPYYARARRAGSTDPTEHCALNVALYDLRPPTQRHWRPSSSIWTMTERASGSLAANATRLSIGRSVLVSDGNTVEIEIDEIAAPLPRRVRGTVRLQAQAASDVSFNLDPGGAHRWRPLAPYARVEVRMEQPEQTWRGTGYFDCNWGDEPIAQRLTRWDWSRALLADGATAVLYDVECRDGSSHTIALHFDQAGHAHPFVPPPRHDLGMSRWRLARCARGSAPPQLACSFEDGPFYARALLRSDLFGTPVIAVHETLSLDRLRAPWVQWLLPFRMPRAPWVVVPRVPGAART